MESPTGEKKIIKIFGFGLCFFMFTTLHLFHHLSLTLNDNDSNGSKHRNGKGSQFIQNMVRKEESYESLINLGNKNQHLKKNIVSQVNYGQVQVEEKYQIVMNKNGDENNESVHKIPFPQSIFNKEWELINHPAIDLVPEYTEPIHQQIQVPKFWNPPLFHSNNEGENIRKLLGNYGERLMTPDETKLVGSFVLPSYDYDEQPEKFIEEEEDGDDDQYVIINQKIVVDLPPAKVEPLQTIFISITPYHDDDGCRGTLSQIFLRARDPERIRVGIVNQIDKEMNGNRYDSMNMTKKCSKPEQPCSKNPDHVLCKFSHLIDEYVMSTGLAAGPIFARHIGNRMYRGEYFAMQIGTRISFINEWDEVLINQWTLANNEMAVITTYLNNVENHYDEDTGSSTNDHRPKMCNTDFVKDNNDDDLLILAHGKQPSGPQESDNGEPILQPQWASVFSFSRGHFVVNIPYDQYLPMVHYGEEISLGLRGFTYGYDYYSPDQNVLFKNVEKKKRENDAITVDPRVHHESKKRLLGIIEMLQSPGEQTKTNTDGEVEGDNKDVKINRDNIVNSMTDWYKAKEKEYGLGKVRTIEKYTNTFGIDLSIKKVEHHMCRFVGSPMNKLFTPHLRKDSMGIDYDEITFKFQDPLIHGNTWETIN